MDNIQQKVLVDGWVFVSEDYSVMGVNNMLLKSEGVCIGSVYERTLKGVTRLRGREGMGIHLGSEGANVVHERPAEYLLLVTGRTGVEPLNQERIKSAYLESVDAAIESLDWNCKTKRNWAMLNSCNHTFTEQASLTANGNVCTACQRFLVVRPRDIPPFGATMNRSMREKLGKDYRVCLIVKRLGEPRSLAGTKNVWNLFQPELCEEIVVHMAKDFWEVGQCLLWETASVNSGGYMGEKHVFNTLFLGRHADFEFDRMKTFGPGVNLPEPGEVFYADLKFSIDSFKQMHYTEWEPWRRPVVERCFTTLPVRGLSETTLSDIKHWINSMKVIRENIGEVGYNTARFEAIMHLSVETLGVKAFEEGNGEAIMAKFDEYFRETFGGVRSHLRRFNFQDYLKQIDETLMPAVSTLEGLVNGVITRRRDGQTLDTKLAEIHDVVLGVACEIVISFGVYGCVNDDSGSNEIRHDRTWIAALNLNPSTFERQPEVFGGLKNVACVKVRGGVGQGQFGGIDYRGPIYLKGHVAETLEKAGMVDAQDLAKLIRELYENIVMNHRTTDEVLPIYKLIAAYIWKELGNKVRKVSNDNLKIDRTPQDWIQLAQEAAAGGHKLIFQNAFEFVERMFNDDNYRSNRALAFCMNELQQILLPSRTRGLMDVIATQLDVELYKCRGLAMMYSWGGADNGIKEISFVLPCVGNAEDAYDFMSNESFYRDSALKQQGVREVWEFAFRQTYKRDIGDPEAVTIYLRQAQEKQNIRNARGAGLMLEFFYVRSLMAERAPIL